MTAQVLIIGFAVLKIAFDGALAILADRRRKMPLPDIVSDVYEADRYAEYLAYTSERKRAKAIRDIALTAALAIVMLSGFFKILDGITGGNAYAIAAITLIVFWIIYVIGNTALSFYLTFIVDEKYGMNKQDSRGFAKDTAVDELPMLAFGLAFVLAFAFVGENAPALNGGPSMGLALGEGTRLALVAGASIAVVAVAVMPVMAMFGKHKLKPLPEGELRSEIERLIAASGKKVRQIYVYDESSRSTRKNAFMMRILGFRFLGIADNFVDECPRREVMAALSHEVGHLKHWWNVWDLGAVAILCAFVACTAALVHPETVLSLLDWIRESSGIATTNYALAVCVLGVAITPLIYATMVFRNCAARTREYRADREAVRLGYGRELEESLKRVARDELQDVNPHPVIEFLGYNHPGLANRVSAIRQAAVEYGGEPISA